MLTLFPLVYGWWVCLPWVLACWVQQRLVSGLLLLVGMVSFLGQQSDSELQLQHRVGVGDYVHAFSLVLGVYVLTPFLLIPSDDFFA